MEFLEKGYHSPDVVRDRVARREYAEHVVENMGRGVLPPSDSPDWQNPSVQYQIGQALIKGSKDAALLDALRLTRSFILGE